MKVTGPRNISHKRPSSKLNLEIIKTNILSKIHDRDFPRLNLGLSDLFPLEKKVNFPNFQLKKIPQKG